MLRLLVLCLLLANGAYFAWSQGHLRAWGYGPAAQTEPHRMAQQIKPEAIRLLKPAESAAAEAAASARPADCLVAGRFDEAQTAVLRRALEDLLPPGSWTLDESAEPARWIIYMGKYPNAQALEAKRAELLALRLSISPVGKPELEPGFSLGAHPSQREADAALVALGKRGVRTAKVVQEQAASTLAMLKLPAVDDALRVKLDALGPVLSGKALRPCS
jgi:hypothetical protein